MALLTNERINNILVAIQEYYIKGDVAKWYKYVKQLYKETIIYLKVDERKPFNILMREIIDLAPVRDKTGLKYRTILKYKLEDFEVHCRIILHDKGVMTSKGQDLSRLL